MPQLQFLTPLPPSYTSVYKKDHLPLPLCIRNLWMSPMVEIVVNLVKALQTNIMQCLHVLSTMQNQDD